MGKGVGTDKSGEGCITFQYDPNGAPLGGVREKKHIRMANQAEYICLMQVCSSCKTVIYLQKREHQNDIDMTN
jgi:hypothetical protein